MSLDPLVTHHRARVAALSRWAAEPDPVAQTAPARAAFLARFELEVDPDGHLPELERSRRALIARRLYFARLTFARVSAASKNKSAATELQLPAAGAGHVNSTQ